MEVLGDELLKMSVQAGLSYFLVVFMSASNIGQGCRVNITVAVLVESSSVLDFPFQINRTVGIIEQATEKARDILAGTAHLEFIIRQADVPTCTSLLWGALVADVYYGNDIHAIIGPGKY